MYVCYVYECMYVRVGWVFGYKVEISLLFSFSECPLLALGRLDYNF